MTSMYSCVDCRDLWPMAVMIVFAPIPIALRAVANDRRPECEDAMIPADR